MTNLRHVIAQFHPRLTHLKLLTKTKLLCRHMSLALDSTSQNVLTLQSYHRALGQWHICC